MAELIKSSVWKIVGEIMETTEPAGIDESISLINRENPEFQPSIDSLVAHKEVRMYKAEIHRQRDKNSESGVITRKGIMTLYGQIGVRLEGHAMPAQYPMWIKYCRTQEFHPKPTDNSLPAQQVYLGVGLYSKQYPKGEQMPRVEAQLTRQKNELTKQIETFVSVSISEGSRESRRTVNRLLEIVQQYGQIKSWEQTKR